LGRPTTEVWLRTKDGTYFLPAGTEMYVLVAEWPVHGQWTVVTVPVHPKDGRARMTEHRALPLDQALVWAGELAMDLGVDLNTTSKDAKWRKALPREKFINFARRLGVKPEGHVDAETGTFVCTERQGSLADRVKVVQGSARIDPIIRAVRAK
jgi:hypothetical protein